MTGRAKPESAKRMPPSINSMGTKTIMVVRVAVVIAKPISLTPLIQASRLDMPLLNWR